MDHAQTSRPATPDPPKRRGYMRETYHLKVNQETLQRNWSMHRSQRHRKYGTLQAPGSRLVRWTDRVDVVCGDCRRTLGHVVAFRADDTFGIVEDTVRWQPNKTRNLPVLTGEGKKHPPWLWVEGDLRKAHAHFWCPKCRRDVLRNAHRLGKEIVDGSLAEVAVK